MQGLSAWIAIGSTVAQASTGNLVWTHASQQENWVGNVVALGNDGNHVFSEFEGYHGFARLLASQDQNPPTPVWQHEVPFMSFASRIDSADTADMFVALHFEQESATATRKPVLSKYSSTNGTPQWKYTYPLNVINPPSGVGVSRNGQRIVGWVYDFNTLKTVVAVFQPASATPLSYTSLDTLGAPITGKLSSDGSTLYLVSSIKTMVFDVGSASLLWQGFNTTSVSLGHAISGDGRVFAKSADQRKVGVYRREGASYVPWFTHEIADSAACMNIEISDDGGTMVCGFNYGSPYLQVRVQVIDLGSSAHPVIFDDSVTGGGSSIHVIKDLALSANGQTLAVGSSGDQLGLAPEVMIYGRDAQSGAWSRVFEYDLAGSVNDVDVSHDGRRVGAASKSVHMSVAGSGGRIDLFDLHAPIAPTADLELEGTAHLGSTVTFHQYLAAGTPAVLLRSPNLAVAPTLFPGVGTLYLQRSTASIVATGVANSNGVLSSTVTIPNDPSLVGLTFYFQGLSTVPRELSEDWVQLTVVP